MTTNHHYILFFTNMGRVYRLKAYEIPEASRTSRGTAIINLLQLQPDEHISATITVRGFDFDSYLLMATKGGIIKTTRLSEYANIRKTGLIAITLREGDELIGVKCTDEKQDVVLVTKNGMAVRFNETEVRVTSRQSMGVIGINLDDDDEVVAMQLTEQGKYLLTVSELGYGKLTPISEFESHHRAVKGIRCYKIMDKSGPLVGAKIVNTEGDIIIITNGGIVIRLEIADIRVCGRSTTGVKLINLDGEKNTSVARFARVRETEEDAETNAGQSGEVETAVPMDDDEEEDSEEEKMTIHDSEYGDESTDEES